MTYVYDHEYCDDYYGLDKLDNELNPIIEAGTYCRFVIFNHFAMLFKIPAREKKYPGYVYAISDGRYIKIGATTNVKGRLSKLQTSNARKLTLAGLERVDDMFYVETHLHNRFKQWCVLNEWYDLYAAFDLNEKGALEIVKKREKLHRMMMGKIGD